MVGRQDAGNRKREEKHYRVFVLLCVLFHLCCMLSTVSRAETVRSRAAVVMDASSGKVLYAKNPDLRCPPASTTKLMTAILAVEHMKPESVVTVSKRAATVSPHKAGLREGDRVTVEELLYAALLGSANDAAVALAEAVAGSEERFVELMNGKAAAIGARDTRFINPHGLPGPGQYISASDLSRIMQYALRSPLLRQIISTRATEIETEGGRAIPLRNTNRLLWTDGDVIGGKTGYTRTARHCFVCAAERSDDAVIVALLGSPSRNNLWRESDRLLDRGFTVLQGGAEPVVYLAKAGGAAAAGFMAKKRKTRVEKSSRTKKTCVLTADRAGGSAKLACARKKGATYEKHRDKTKRYRVARKGISEKNKG